MPACTQPNPAPNPTHPTPARADSHIEGWQGGITTRTSMLIAKACTFVRCYGHGGAALGPGSTGRLDGCTFEDCGSCGVAVGGGPCWCWCWGLCCAVLPLVVLCFSVLLCFPWSCCAVFLLVFSFGREWRACGSCAHRARP